MLVTNAAGGAVVGAAFAGLALIVGVGRMALALLAGRTMEALSWSDARMLALYVISFVLAGALVGALRTYVTGRAGTFGTMALGGAIVMCSIAIADQGLAAMTQADWIAMTVIGAIFGCAAAYGMTRAP